MLVSDCCGAEIIFTDICSDCKEHCEPIEDEEECYESDEPEIDTFSDADPGL